ncbi:hypothetical protein DEO72_LG5g2413 [Vigna unguiculata]|uniref:Uncharacterized protein n=1 Tax=Vigna unguiculata TaxID=3917 RepID=A0A4D6M0E6_VIGUN|nr:hypothetical protein DEO72_LG5g2413 [Vigna unguiculata]
METVPPGGSYRPCDLWGAWRLAARVPRQVIRTAATLNLDCVCVIYVASNGALKVGLLEFLELWLGTYPLSCGSG